MTRGIAIALEHVSDLDLLSPARAGDRACMDQLVVRARAYARRTVERMLSGFAGDVDDVLQHVCDVVWTKLDDFRGESPASFRAWVRRIARNASIDQIRAHHNDFEPLDGDPDDASRATDPERMLRRQRIRVLILRAVADLPERQREVLMRRVFDGQSYREIASDLGIEVNTVSPTLAAARRSLARTFEQQGLER